MEEQEQAPKNIKKAPKMLKIATIIAGSIVLFLIVAFFGLSWYGEWRLQRDVAQIIEQQNRPYLEDTYGGKTPKETLDLFITAVEKGDFTLASKYFVLDKQEEWEKRLENGDRQKLNNWVDSLKRAQERGSLWEGNFQMEVKSEGDKIGLVIDFTKYPSSVWKIQEL